MRTIGIILLGIVSSGLCAGVVWLASGAITLQHPEIPALSPGWSAVIGAAVGLRGVLHQLL